MLKYEDLAKQERDEYLEIIIRESGRLSALATNVLNLSKVESQTILTGQEAYDLTEQVRRCILLLEPQWEEKKLDLSVELEDLQYYGNQDMLSQVWLNLIDNAIKFSPKNSTIDISLKQDDSAIKFTIADSGVGIDAETLPHIYDKFYQGDSSHATIGNGLGLAVTQRIVSLHGGDIDCQSRPDLGTVFIVSLPVR